MSGSLKPSSCRPFFLACCRLLAVTLFAPQIIGTNSLPFGLVTPGWPTFQV
ncbi:hypothetical protein SAMN04489832_2324 [Micromonospora cremea]|uniref:Uncharacterized protein n=1 Tax=Micromonospora cremea TaxID=709881 RepID=A0A1N5WBC3_9ACTN|nr:hypothetical protein SAMN04489832_2324 [Micromonospora cremea]